MVSLLGLCAYLRTTPLVVGPAMMSTEYLQSFPAALSVLFVRRVEEDDCVVDERQVRLV